MIGPPTFLDRQGSAWLFPFRSVWSARAFNCRGVSKRGCCLRLPAYEHVKVPISILLINLNKCADGFLFSVAVQRAFSCNSKSRFLSLGKCQRGPEKVLGRFLLDRTVDWPDHSRRNENLTFNQNYPARSFNS